MEVLLSSMSAAFLGVEHLGMQVGCSNWGAKGGQGARRRGMHGGALESECYQGRDPCKHVWPLLPLSSSIPPEGSMWSLALPLSSSIPQGS